MSGFDAARHERRHVWYARGARLAVCLLTCIVTLWVFGPLGMLIALPVFAIVYARSLLELPGALRRKVRAAELRELDGRFFEFKGVPMRVLDDDIERMRWLNVADLGRALGETLKLSSMKQRYAEGTREMKDGLYLSDEAALAYLASRSTDRSARLRVWVEQEVWYPIRHKHGGRLRS